MPNMWNYFLGAIDKGMPYAVKAEDARQQDVALGIQQQNADTGRMEHQLRRDEFQDSLVDFADAAQGYTGPLADEMTMIDRAVGGRKTSYSKIVPWIQPETMRDMSGRAERMQERMLSEQAKTLAAQMERAKMLSAALAKLRGPQPELLPGPYMEQTPNFVGRAANLGETMLNYGPLGYSSWLAPIFKGVRGLADKYFPGLLSDFGDVKQGMPTGNTINTDTVPDATGLTPAQQVALLTTGPYDEVQDLARRGNMPGEQNLALAYQAAQYALTDPGLGYVSADPSTAPLIQYVHSLTQGMMPQGVAQATRQQALETLKALQREKLSEQEAKARLALEAAKKK